MLILKMDGIGPGSFQCVDLAVNIPLAFICGATAITVCHGITSYSGFGLCSRKGLSVFREHIRPYPAGFPLKQGQISASVICSRKQMVLRTVILEQRAACAALLRYNDVLFSTFASDCEYVPQHMRFTVNGSYEVQPQIVSHPHEIDCSWRGGHYVHAGKGQACFQWCVAIIAGLVLRQEIESLPCFGRLQGFEV